VQRSQPSRLGSSAQPRPDVDPIQFYGSWWLVQPSSDATGWKLPRRGAAPPSPELIVDVHGRLVGKVSLGGCTLRIGEADRRGNREMPNRSASAIEVDVTDTKPVNGGTCPAVSSVVVSVTSSGVREIAVTTSSGSKPDGTLRAQLSWTR